MYPIKDYGHIIHEFDPWFNYRATEYLAEHGLSKFFKWYDYESWYPLGRPIGTTIYPGMQMTGVFIWEVMKKIPAFDYEIPGFVRAFNAILKYCKKDLGFMFIPAIPKSINFEPMTVNDICCLIPPWFGSVASLFTGLLAYETTRSMNTAVLATGIMAVIPAHLMRSVGGEFDNEAIAMSAICSTFWLWCRSVRNPQSWYFGFLTGFSYMYMVAAWGGYIFVLNMIGLHALMLVGLGRFNSGVYKAYTIFFIIGTYGAMQVPVVGWQPLRSLEQMGPLLVFLGYQVLYFCDVMRRKHDMSAVDFVKFRIKVCAMLLAGLVGVVILLWPTGYFGPLSSRIRGLFVKHTKTGNPLVDSVAEHQPASAGTYATHLNLPLDYVYWGGAVCMWNRTSGCYFAALYGFIAAHFSGKMSRLVLICAPIVTIYCAIWFGWLFDQLLEPFLLLLGKKGYTPPDGAIAPKKEAPKEEPTTPASADAKKDGKSGKAKSLPKKPNKTEGKSKKGSSYTGRHTIPLMEWDEDERPGGMAAIKKSIKLVIYDSIPPDLEKQYYEARTFIDGNYLPIGVRCLLSIFILLYMHTLGGNTIKWTQFVRHSDRIARQIGNPQVVYKVPDRKGGQILIDDYLKGYQWIKENTPRDSRVMAWWDYGYQITGIAERTSIADGNTWNHEHIATLGRTLTSPQKKAWNAIRHLADYVLVWAGGGGDDLAKSPHLARIGNSVFPEHCGDKDPLCQKFSFHGDGSPTKMMANSLLYNMCSHNVKPGAKVDERLFKEVHTTKYGLMRVYKVMNVSQESKEWIADPKNKLCDAPGSWYCVGQYPPALEKLISKRRSFSQVEDFNKAGEKSAYTKLIDKQLHGEEF
jgi:dolichyl-diphosphooligosaccharide--protein glycosyltransferase